MANRFDLEGELNQRFSARTVEEWLGLFREVGLPAGPVLSIAQMHADPQAIAREMIASVEHPTAGEVKTIGHPIRFSQTPGGPVSGAPLHGEHTREILRETGYSAAEIEGMLASGAVRVAER